MNVKVIIEYLTKDVANAKGAYVLVDNGNGVEVESWFEPTLGVQPTMAQMQAAEADALTWKASQKVMTYDALFKLMPRAIRAKAQEYKDTLKASSVASEKAFGYQLAELERDISTGELYDDSDTAQRTEFDVIRAAFVTAGVITQSQADDWGNLSEVTA